MTGSGATLLVGVAAEAEAALVRRLPVGARLMRVRTLSRQEVAGMFRSS
jgi:hypothetical protein